MPDESLASVGALRPGDEPFVVALAMLDLFPRQLCSLVFTGGAEAAWTGICAGRPSVAVPDHVAKAWQHRARRIDPAQVMAAHSEAGVGVALLGGPSYPADLVDDIEAPLVLFHRGDPGICEGPRVAVVGTRHASGYGLDLAAAWGEALSDAGVVVVSGLASGIDAAAHAGSLRGPTPPIAVVGSGIDVVYPRRNHALWHAVATRGLLLSEYPLGTAAAAPHFPARNRILAGLADVVVVIESHDTGGSLLTAAAGLARHRTVMAVPGPVHSAASRGTNALLRDGAGVACEVDDVLIALGLSAGSRRSRTVELRATPSPLEGQVLEAMGWTATTVDALAIRLPLSLLELAGALESLVAKGWITRAHGHFARVARGKRSVPAGSGADG